MVTLHPCPKCSKTFPNKTMLKRHFAKKFPCDEGRFKCEKCDQFFHNRNGRDHHRRHTCKGPQPSASALQLLQPQLQEARKRIHELEQELAVVTEHIAEGDEVDNDQEDEPEECVWVKPTDFEIKTVIECDVEHPQVYFLQPGNLLQPLARTYGIPVKLGGTDATYTRVATHARDFGGAKLTDSVKTNNPKYVETKLKRWLRATARFVDCKTPKKKGIEQEVFAAQNQEDYAMIVKKAQDFADEYSKNIETQSSLIDKLQTILQAIPAPTN